MLERENVLQRKRRLPHCRCQAVEMKGGRTDPFAQPPGTYSSVFDERELPGPFLFLGWGLWSRGGVLLGRSLMLLRCCRPLLG